MVNMIRYQPPFFLSSLIAGLFWSVGEHTHLILRREVKLFSFSHRQCSGGADSEADRSSTGNDTVEQCYSHQWLDCWGVRPQSRF